MSGLVPGSRAARLVAVMILGLVALLLWQLVAAPLIEMRDSLDSEIALTRTSHDRLYTQVAGTPRRADNTVMVEPTRALAAARLQGEMEALVEAAGGRIERLEASVLPRERADRRLESVRGAVTFTATTAQLRQVLMAVEAAPLALVVDELGIAPAGTGDAAPDGRLTIDLSVRGFRIKGSGA